MDHGVELALGEHRLDRFIVREARELEPGRRREVDVLVELGDPFDRGMRHAVFLFQQPAHPVDRGDEERLDADAAADQVGRLLDPLRRIDEHEAVAEAAMQEHRQRTHRPVLAAGDDVGRRRGLRHVEVAVAQEAPMPGRRIHVGEHGEVDAVRLHRPLLERAGDLVIAAGERDGDVLRQRRSSEFRRFASRRRSALWAGHGRACPGHPAQQGTAVPHDRGRRDKPGDDS